MTTKSAELDRKGAREVLLTLFIYGSTSQRQIWVRVNELETKDKKTKTSWGQILKLVQALQRIGFVEWTRGKRNSKNCGLTDKAFFYIVLYESQPYSKHPIGMRRFFQVVFPSFGYSLPTEGPMKEFFDHVFEDAQKEVRKRVNFEFFDGEYAQWVYVEALIVALYRGFKNPPKALTQVKLSLSKEGRGQMLPIVKELRDQARKHREFIEGRERLFAKTIELIEGKSSNNLSLSSD